MLAQSYDTSGNAALETQTALARPGVPEEPAKLIAFLLSDASTFTTGSVYSIDGGWNC
jgi:NAD(P)-dependent dehydrogenase (short-subunit alcohol dehydrogenase family)